MTNKSNDQTSDKIAVASQVVNSQGESFNITRRSALSALGNATLLGAGMLAAGDALAQRGGPRSSSSRSSSSVASSAVSSSVASSSVSGSCVLIPTETIGPYPLSTLLNSSIILRENVAEDKTGVPLKVNLKLVNVNNNCTPVSAYVYIWHCDKDGNYSGYSTDVGKTYCRGVQYTNSSGVASFTTIYPGWYAGRITHIHFQVFLNSYSSTAQSTAISQLAFPPAVTQAVYSSSLYTKGQNTSVASFSADNVFSDGVTYQLATVTGSVSTGYVADLQVGIAI